MRLEAADRPGSVDFDRSGGLLANFLCCGFNPIRTCMPPPASYYHLSPDNVLMYGEEPGPGLCLCVMAGPHSLAFPCLACMICPSYVHCGVTMRVNCNGLTFSIVNGAIQCKISAKHCWTEDPSVILFDVQEIRQVERRKAVRHGEDSSWTVTYYMFEIVHRDTAGLLQNYRTHELVLPDDHTPFIDAVNQFIKTYRTVTTASVPLAVAMVDRGSGPIVAVPVVAVPVQSQATIYQNQSYTAVPAPQQLAMRSFASIRPNEEYDMY